jgi:plasmid stabilization system protein ParE
MSYKITIADAAEQDVRDAFLWNEEQKEDLGSSFEKHFSKAVDSIQDNPLKFQIRYNNTRVFFLKKFPYGIHFNVNNKNILIIAVFHTSQNPTNWKNR